MALTAIEVKRLSCPEGRKQVKKSDGNGLFLLVKSSGSKLWRMRYRFNNKHQELALGQYPTVSLAEARKMAAEARVLLVQGINPTAERRERKQATAVRPFGEIALGWLDQQEGAWSPGYAKKVRRWIATELKPINGLPVDSVDQGHIADIMLSIEAAGHPRTAPVVLSVINRVFGYALAHRYTRNNPAQGLSLSDILKPMPKVEHRAAITQPQELSKLIRDIDGDESGSYCTVEALKLIPRLFLRPKEIRCLRWGYVDFEQAMIRIPAEEMKMGREHLVPLASQVVSQLREVRDVTGYSPFVFPSQRNSDNPLSKNVMTNRLRDLGYSADVMVAHGFRSTASTILHEQGWHHDVVETQLAHLTGTSTSRAYNRSAYLAERTQMMQQWADYLAALRDGADVVSINGRANG